MEYPLTPGIAERLRRGESEAIESVVDAFHGPIYRYFLYRGSITQEAEDLTSETYFQVLKSISSFRGNDEQIRAFVFATARHVLASSYRIRSRSVNTIDVEITIADPENSPIEHLLARERDSNVSRAIEKLGDVEREIVVLRFIENLSLSEIAAVCSMPIGTVKSHLHRAKGNLKHELTDLEPLQ